MIPRTSATLFQLSKRCIDSKDLWQTACLIALAVLIGLPSTLVAQEGKITEAGLRQIQTLLEEKASRTPAQRKMSSKLILEVKRRRGDALMNALPNLRSTLEVQRDGTTLVDIRADVSETLLGKIEDLGGGVVSSFPKFRAIRAWMPLDDLETLAAESEVQSIKPYAKMTTNKDNTSEGDVAHGANLARPLLGVNGTGVTVGVLSNGVDSLGDRQLTGDLPDPVVILPGQAGSGDEGTAMLEIVHDLAPGANLLFATASGGEAQFAQNILDLRTAGADVIVDDVFYFSEPVFQDGDIANSVDMVTINGALYFSSAGNSGNLNDGESGAWEGDFSSAGTDPPALAGSDAHDFGGGVSLNTITIDSPSFFILNWSDPQGGSANDYDLIQLDATGNTILDVGEDVQDGDDDPIEFIDSGPWDDTGTTLAIIRYAGAARFLNLTTHRGRLAIGTDGQTAGHNSAVGAFGVAAVDVADAGGGLFTGGPANPVETFSSDGPRRVFYNWDGTPVVPGGDYTATGGELRQKPDIAAADGVSTAAPGFDPFFGTSAAAPHAAAIAALMQQTGNLTRSGAAQVFAATCLDIEAAGIDRDSGYGLVEAEAAVGTVVSPTTGSNCYVNDLTLTGTPNNGAQTFRACDSISANSGIFDEVTFVAFDGINPGVVVFGNGFTSDSLSVWVSSVPTP